MSLDYERDMTIDESALDIEWLEQPNLALRYGRHVVGLRQRLARAAERVKTVRSELVDEANKDPRGTTGKDKPNAGDIEAYYRRHTRYQEAKDEEIELQAELDMAEIAREEICWTRKKALENLVILHGQQYFAGPRVPRDLSKELQDRQQQRRVDEGVSRRMVRRTAGRRSSSDENQRRTDGKGS